MEDQPQTQHQTTPGHNCGWQVSTESVKQIPGAGGLTEELQHWTKDDSEWSKQGQGTTRPHQQRLQRQGWKCAHEQFRFTTRGQTATASHGPGKSYQKVFGKRFRVFSSTILLYPDTAAKISQAWLDERCSEAYVPPALADWENADHRVKEGAWRTTVTYIRELNFKWHCQI